MNTSNRTTSLLAAALGFIVLGAPAFGQVTTNVPIYVMDNGSGSAPGNDTLWLGVNPSATNGKDSELGEEEVPPAPPEGVFDARWVNVGSSNNLGQGVKKNYRKYLSGDQADTFRMRLQPGFQPGGAGYPMTIVWPDLKRYFQSATLRFVDGDGNPMVQDMMTASSFQFSNPSSVSSTITIYTAGPRSASGVPQAELLAFELSFDAVPNPVRRETGVALSYELPHASDVMVALYDARGAEVRRLFEGAQGASEQTLRIDTRGLAAGSYYCIVKAGELSATRSFVVTD